MNLVAVTACPTGIAHTYMAAEKLSKMANTMGINIKIETQGALGVENQLQANDIQSAAGVILAVDIAIEGEERFNSKPLLKVSVKDAIKDPAKLIKDIMSKVQ